MELDINKYVVFFITLKHNYGFHDYNLLGTMLRRIRNHDYLDVAMSSDVNWLNHVKKFQQG